MDTEIVTKGSDLASEAIRNGAQYDGSTYVIVVSVVGIILYQLARLWLIEYPRQKANEAMLNAVVEGQRQSTEANKETASFLRILSDEGKSIRRGFQAVIAALRKLSKGEDCGEELGRAAENLDAS